MQAKWSLKDKKIIIYGLGVTGRSAIKVLNNMGAKLFIFIDGDLRDDDRDFLKAYPRICIKKEGESFLQERSSKDFYIKNIFETDIDFILRSSGIRPEKILLKMADKEGLPYYSDLELAYRLYGGERMIAITGSNGKTTTTSLLTHILKEGGFKAQSCGNIGIPLLEEMDEKGDEYFFVVESSSFQLAKIYDFAPHRAAILNITEDHLEWHHSFAAYLGAKLNIGKFQKETDKLWINRESRDLIEKNKDFKNFKAEKIFIDTDDNSDFAQGVKKSLKYLRGRHNLQNALFASLIAKDCGLSESKIYRALEIFKPIAHRMEDLGEIKGIKFINDSKATNVDSTVKALSALDKNVILIAGGYDKEVSFDALYEALGNVKALLLIGQTGEEIGNGARDKGFKGLISNCQSLDRAFKEAVKIGRKDDIVLLSPASASWDQFKGYEDRGDSFRSLVESFKEEK